MNKPVDLNIKEWIEKLQAKGKHAFSLEFLSAELPNYSDIGINRVLSRLTTKGLITSIYKGYYLIIPPQYSTKGILPPTIYLDSFMKFLERPYYLALLNASAFHGASHQQPQEFFVVTSLPTLRPTLKKGVKINYISKHTIPTHLLESIKTESGYIKISKPILTAIDLILFEKRIGGMSRVATILNELIEKINSKDFSSSLIEYAPVTALQRLGYLLEHVLENKQLADALFEKLTLSKVTLFRTPLKASAPVKSYPSDQRWKVIVNTQIEIDE